MIGYSRIWRWSAMLLYPSGQMSDCFTNVNVICIVQTFEFINYIDQQRQGSTAFQWKIIFYFERCENNSNVDTIIFLNNSLKGRIVQPPKTGLKYTSAAAPTLQQTVACQSSPLSFRLNTGLPNLYAPWWQTEELKVSGKKVGKSLFSYKKDEYCMFFLCWKTPHTIVVL